MLEHAQIIVVANTVFNLALYTPKECGINVHQTNKSNFAGIKCFWHGLATRKSQHYYTVFQDTLLELSTFQPILQR